MHLNLIFHVNTKENFIHNRKGGLNWTGWIDLHVYKVPRRQIMVSGVTMPMAVLIVLKVCHHTITLFPKSQCLLWPHTAL